MCRSGGEHNDDQPCLDFFKHLAVLQADLTLLMSFVYFQKAQFLLLLYRSCAPSLNKSLLLLEQSHQAAATTFTPPSFLPFSISSRTCIVCNLDQSRAVLSSHKKTLWFQLFKDPDIWRMHYAFTCKTVRSCIHKNSLDSLKQVR